MFIWLLTAFESWSPPKAAWDAQYRQLLVILDEAGDEQAALKDGDA
jgi:hypothetical protein